MLCRPSPRYVWLRWRGVLTQGLLHHKLLHHKNNPIDETPLMASGLWGFPDPARRNLPVNALIDSDDDSEPSLNEACRFRTCQVVCWLQAGLRALDNAMLDGTWSVGIRPTCRSNTGGGTDTVRLMAGSNPGRLTTTR